MKWEVTAILDEPSRTLEAWSVMEIPFDGRGKPWTRHFVGFKHESCVGQVSTPIESFDPQTRRGRTRSGRVYELRGKPGFNSDAFALWSGFKQANHIDEERDVSSEVEALLHPDDE